MAAQHRFADLTSDDILAKRANVIPKNTINCNLKSARTLRSYLVEKKQDVEFEKYSPERLSETLKFFYLDARTPNGQLYKSTSLENFRYSLNRYLKSPPHLAKFDIIRDTTFIEANESFKIALAEIKQSGKGAIVHFPEISDLDLKTLYGSLHMSPDTPHGLANKVQFEVRLYFCRRGGENMTEMKPDDFRVETDPETGLRLIRKTRDELTKNRRATEKEGYRGIMPEIPNCEMCPVQSFVKYIEKLKPNIDRLWQRPKDSFLPEESTWFCCRPLGKDTLSNFMTRLSKSANLSQAYTNHTIRVTGTTILSRKNFSPAQIMSITGHKSTSSLAVYQRVNRKEKFSMGSAIADAVLPGNPFNLLTIESVASPSPAMYHHARQAVASDSQMSSVDWDSFFSVDPFVNEAMPSNVTQQSGFGPIFQNCQIGKVEIVLRK